MNFANLCHSYLFIYSLIDFYENGTISAHLRMNIHVLNETLGTTTRCANLNIQSIYIESLILWSIKSVLRRSNEVRRYRCREVDCRSADTCLLAAVVAKQIEIKYWWYRRRQRKEEFCYECWIIARAIIGRFVALIIKTSLQYKQNKFYFSFYLCRTLWTGWTAFDTWVVFFCHSKRIELNIKTTFCSFLSVKLLFC